MHRFHLSLIICLLVVTLCVGNTRVYAVLQSSNYQIGADSINFGGTEDSVSTNYGLRDTGGEVASGESSGLLYAIGAGYRKMVEIAVSAISTPASDGSGSQSNASSGGGGGVLTQDSFSVQSVAVAVGSDTLLFDVSLNQPGKVALVWGVSTLYDGGSVASDVFRSNHVIKVQNLAPGTTYYFAIQAVSEIGAQTGQVLQSATTLSEADTVAPANPLNLTVLPTTSGADISWRQPSGNDIELVRVVRSDTFYPTDPTDGVVVYEGRADSVADAGVVEGTTYYYTLFTKDVSGNFSSGAIAKIYIPKAGEVVLDTAGDGFTDGKISMRPDPAFDALSLLDFFVTQDASMTADGQGRIMVDGGNQFAIGVDYAKLPEVLKTIVVSIVDKARPDEVFTFLLRVNDDKTKYEALVDKFDRGGNFAMVISILDYKNQGIKQLTGELVVSEPKQRSLFAQFIEDPLLVIQNAPLYFWILLVVLLIIIRKILKSAYS